MDRRQPLPNRVTSEFTVTRDGPHLEGFASIPQAATSRFGIFNKNGASRIGHCAVGPLVVRGLLETRGPHLARKKASISL